MKANGLDPPIEFLLRSGLHHINGERVIVDHVFQRGMRGRVLCLAGHHQTDQRVIVLHMLGNWGNEDTATHRVHDGRIVGTHAFNTIPDLLPILGWT